MADRPDRARCARARAAPRPLSPAVRAPSARSRPVRACSRARWSRGLEPRPPAASSSSGRARARSPRRSSSGSARAIGSSPSSSSRRSSSSSATLAVARLRLRVGDRAGRRSRRRAALQAGRSHRVGPAVREPAGGDVTRQILDAIRARAASRRHVHDVSVPARATRCRRAAAFRREVDARLGGPASRSTVFRNFPPAFVLTWRRACVAQR